MHLLKLLGLAGVVGLARAQTTAQCAQSTQFSWMYNSLSQDPCTVASYLGGACINGAFNIPPLNATQEYIGPTVQGANPCRCSTVFYSVLSACAVCQFAQTTLWSTYNGNCSSVYASVFPKPIPPATAVPHWAYINVTQTGTFDTIAAEGLGDTPESTAIASATSNSASKPGSTQTSPGSSNSASIPSSTQTSNKSSKAGPIAGGVVGGVVGVALIVGVISFIVAQRRRSYPVQGQTTAAAPQPGQPLPENKPPADYQTYSSYSSPSPPQRPLLYDPSDPRTFPTSPLPRPATPTGATSIASIHAPPTGAYYPGVAEV